MADHLIEQIRSPVIFGHRGASKYAPENTLAAFSLTFKLGAPAIELDAKLSSDGEVVVIHDPTVDRTTDGKGKVNELTLHQLKVLDAGSFFSSKFKGEQIPTLDEVFELSRGKYLVNVELTNYSSFNDQLVPKVAAIVKNHKTLNSVIFSSFSPWNLTRIKNFFPDARTGLLTPNGFIGFLGRSVLMRGISPRYIHPELKDVTPQYIAKEHRSKRRINIWTVDDPVDLKWLIKAGIDGIITNDPLLALKILEEDSWRSLRKKI
jgi:glycerophosphoryl diester phosphodiesterase